MRRRPWTAGEIETARAMRAKHTNREIGETLERSTIAIDQLFKRDDAGRLTDHENRKSLRRTEGPSVSHDADSGALVSHKLRERLGIPATTAEPVGRKSATRETSPAVASGTLEPVLVVSDAHVPFHSRVWWDLLLQVGRFLRPKHLVIIGDFGDFYSVSDHDKDPERANRMDAELAEIDACLDELDALGATDKLYIEGNHEDRLRRHLMRNPALARVVSTERLLRLKERGWEFVPYKRHAQRGAVHFTHDVGAAGRNAVFRALDVYGHSVVSGHTHRLAYIVEGTATGECKLSATFGWGGDVEQIDYMNLAKARKDWALGFGAGYLDPRSGYCYLTPLPVVHGTVCFNGKLFRASA